MCFFLGGKGGEAVEWKDAAVGFDVITLQKTQPHTHIHLYIHTYVCTCVRCDVVVNVQLPERAPKHTMIKRHQEFILLLQAQADSIDPMTGL